MAITMKDVKKIEIPDNGYRELEYIYLGGHSDVFIDMGTGWGFTDCYELHVQLIHESGGDLHNLFGYNDAAMYSYPNYVGSRRSDLRVSSGNIRLTYGYKETANSTIAYIDASPSSGTLYSRKLSIKQFLSNGGVTLKVVDDDTSLILVNQTQNYSSDAFGVQKACLCSLYRYDEDDAAFISEGGMSGYFYNFKVRVSENGQILQDWVPAQRKTDSVVGIYNKINGSFIPVKVSTVLGPKYDYATQSLHHITGPVINEDPDWVQKYEVKKIVIKSSNTMIWGSQAAYPYRRLEYIHFNGTDNYISTGLTDNSTKYRAITFSLDSDETPSSDIYILGSRDTSLDATKQRYWLPRLDGNGIRFVVGSTWTSNGAYPVATYLPANTKRVIYGTTSTSSSNMKLVFGINDASGNTLTSGNITGGAVSGFNQRELALMATNDGSGSSGMTPKGYCAGKVYNLIEKATNSSGTINHNFIPCQRKSDGKYGMYDVVSGSFKALQGTADEYTGGPLVDEYWDLTV